MPLAAAAAAAVAAALLPLVVAVGLGHCWVGPVPAAAVAAGGLEDLQQTSESVMPLYARR